MELRIPSPLQKIELPIFDKYEVSVHIKRDDLINQEISGNKWRKLKFNIEKFKKGRYDAILTFGGAYSNHIAATAFVGKQFEIPTIGIIRGEELSCDSNHTLKQAAVDGMHLQFVDRSTYQQRYEKWYWQELRIEYGNVLIVEEGGANFLGMMGCAETMNEISFEPNYIITASGTGTTAAGLLFNAASTKIVAVPVLKNGEFIRDEIKELLNFSGLLPDDVTVKLENLIMETRFHFGGYGKYNDELIQFMNLWYETTKLPLDCVYTAKMVYAFLEKLKENFFKKGDSIVILHTGGLQGNSSIANELIF